MKILAIETSCDDTAAAVLEDTRVLGGVVSSQVDLHKNWGGVVPDIAMRAHESRIYAVIATALIRAKFSTINYQPSKNKEEKLNQIIDSGINNVDVIAVTLGPGLAPALGVGVKTAKELAVKYKKKLVGVNHIEGHLLSNWIKNSNGIPIRNIEFPALTLTVSGGHTKIVMIKDIGSYEVVGETLDDAAGEALDKAAKLLGLGYPGGPIIERLAEKGDENYLKLPRPMQGHKDFDYSFSGLKTSFYYQIKEWPKEKVSQNLENLSASFQRAVFETLLMKYKKAIEKYEPRTLLASGGVMANLKLKQMLRKLAKEKRLPIYFPYKKEWNTDNAAMIGVVGYFKAKRGEFVKNIESLDRNPRLVL